MPCVDIRDDVKFNVVDEIPKVQLQTTEDVLLFRPRHGPMVNVGKKKLVPASSVQPWKNVSVVLKAALLPSSTRKTLRLLASRIESSNLGKGKHVDGMVVWNGASLLSEIIFDGEQYNSSEI